MRSAVAVSAALALLRAARPAAAICYYPDGTSANDVPCTDKTTESTCCGTGYACYGVTSQYFLCALVDNENNQTDLSSLARGSCTDKDWRSPNCPGVCVEDGRDNLSGGNGVGQCPNSDKDYYCISEGLGVENCTTNYKLIVFADEPSAETTIGVIASTTSSLTTSSSTSTSKPASTPASSTSSSTTTTATSPAAATSTSAAPSSGLSSGGKAGVGVGVSLGVVVIGAVAGLVFFLRRRRRNNALSGGAAAGDGTLGAPGIPLAPTGYSAVTPSPPYDAVKNSYGAHYNDPTKSGNVTPHGSPGQPFLTPVSEMPASPRAVSEMPVSHAEPRYEMQ